MEEQLGNVLEWRYGNYKRPFLQYELKILNSRIINPIRESKENIEIKWDGHLATRFYLTNYLLDLYITWVLISRYIYTPPSQGILDLHSCDIITGMHQLALHHGRFLITKIMTSRHLRFCHNWANIFPPLIILETRTYPGVR